MPERPSFTVPMPGNPGRTTQNPHLLLEATEEIVSSSLEPLKHAERSGGSAVRN
jgi:hypothetical protein